MMNFLFISPDFPLTYNKFCASLMALGWNVFGIGSTPFHKLDPKLKELTEYVYIQNLNNYTDVFAAAKHLINKHGQMSGLESNNEHWLEQDAMLRSDLDIEGIKPQALEFYKYKSKMKIEFNEGKIATVPYVVTRSYKDAEVFVQEQGYPIFAKPNKGVGAKSTRKITNEIELHNMFAIPLAEDYIFEVYIEGNLYSYDGLTDKCGNLVFEAAHFFETPIDTLKSTGGECIYHTLRTIPEKLVAAGRAAVQAFDLKARFFHIEFFELAKPIKGVGEAGDFVGIEVNMRPAGGLTPEMMNAAKGINVYELWAECIHKESVPACKTSNDFYCTNVGRHSRKQYKYSSEQLHEKFPGSLVFFGHTSDDENPFGNDEVVGKFSTMEECKEFSIIVTQHNDQI